MDKLRNITIKTKKNIYLGLSIFWLVGVIAMLSDGFSSYTIGGALFYFILSSIFFFLYKKTKKNIDEKNRQLPKVDENINISVSGPTKNEYDFDDIKEVKTYREVSSPSSLYSEDSLYEEVKEFVVMEQKASTSLIQRRFGIGYNRAERIIDVLEANGVIGPMNGSKPREVFLTYEDLIDYSIQSYHSDNTKLNDFHTKIANDKNIANEDKYLDPVLEYCLEQEEFSLDDFQKHFDFSFSQTSSYYDTLKALEVIDEKYNLTNDYSDINEIKDIIKTATQNNPNIVSLARLNNLNDGYEFEEFIANLLLDLGYEKAEVTQSSNDYGVDVIAVNDGITYAFQCKLYSSTVGNAAVQEIVSGMPHYSAHVGIVVTNNYFTRQAIELAKSNNIILWDGDVLIAKLNEVRK